MTSLPLFRRLRTEETTRAVPRSRLRLRIDSSALLPGDYFLLVSPIQDVLEVFFYLDELRPDGRDCFTSSERKIYFFMYGVLRDADALELTLLLKGMKAALLDVSRMVCDF